MCTAYIRAMSERRELKRRRPGGNDHGEGGSDQYPNGESRAKEIWIAGTRAWVAKAKKIRPRNEQLEQHRAYPAKSEKRIVYRFLNIVEFFFMYDAPISDIRRAYKRRQSSCTSLNAKCDTLRS